MCGSGHGFRAEKQTLQRKLNNFRVTKQIIPLRYSGLMITFLSQKGNVQKHASAFKKSRLNKARPSLRRHLLKGDPSRLTLAERIKRAITKHREM